MRNIINISKLIGFFFILGLASNTAQAITPGQRFNDAEACYQNLNDNPIHQLNRKNWLTCIKKYQSVYKYDPAGSWAAAGMYMSGVLYRKLYLHLSYDADQKEAIDILGRVIRRFPKSKYKTKAVEELKKYSQPDEFPEPDPADKPLGGENSRSADSPEKENSHPMNKTAVRVQKITPPPPSPDSAVLTPLSSITGLRFWSNPSYTRVVVDAESDVAYTHRLLKKSPATNKPHRLYIDLEKTLLKKGFKKKIAINDNLLINARADQHSTDSVRVVIDIKSFENYKIFSLKNPFRIVIDVWGRTLSQTYAHKKEHQKGQIEKKADTSTIAKQLALGVRRIVIDPGHGGRDFGAPGYKKGVHEKNVTLEIGRKLAKKIKATLNCEVIMTRTDDRTLELEERTAMANTSSADLFISLHTNAVRNPRAYGIETYFLNLATDADAIQVAARENATSTKNISDLEAILADLMQSAKINESSRLAGYVQTSLVKHLKRKYSRIKDKGVKQAPFYVLIGAQMPAILIEMSFISNPRECNRLIDAKYQNRLCEAIIMGIMTYMEALNPTAFLKKNKNWSG
jgi:N-acetylmuramoyl-L-alanine amidase